MKIKINGKNIKNPIERIFYMIIALAITILVFIFTGVLWLGVGLFLTSWLWIPALLIYFIVR